MNFSEVSFPFRFPDQSFVRMSDQCHAYYQSRPSSSLWLDYRNNVCSRTQTIIEERNRKTKNAVIFVPYWTHDVFLVHNFDFPHNTRKWTCNVSGRLPFTCFDVLCLVRRVLSLRRQAPFGFPRATVLIAALKTPILTPRVLLVQLTG